MEIRVEFSASREVLALDLAEVQTKTPRQAEAREVVDFGHGAKPHAAYIENELPQPQVPLACGLVMLKPRLFRSSWKSTVTPCRYNRLRLSITTGTPCISNVSSSFRFTSGSRSSLCWNPLQPPPTTRMRRCNGRVSPAETWSAMIFLTSPAALGVSTI